MTIRLLSVGICMVLLAGCSKPNAPETPAAALRANTAQSAATGEDAEDQAGPDREDPCQLLQVAEVEAVLGPLAGPPYRSNANNDQPMARGDSCRYVGRDLRSIELNVSRSGGGLLLKGMDVGEQAARDTHMKGQLPKGLLPADTTFAGEWDDMRVIGCCRMNAFLGESLIVLDFTGSRATPLQAVDLVNKALLRLNKPLPIDGRAGIEPAKQRLAAAMKHPRPCQLVTRAEAEAIVGKLTSDPVEKDSECQYRYRSGNGSDDGGSDEVVNLKVEWSYGFDRFREDAAVHAAVGGGAADTAVKAMSDISKAMQAGGNSFESLAKALKQQQGPADQQAPKQPATDATIAGPWDEAAFAYPEFLAVKKDILIRVEAGTTAEIGQKFAAKAMQKI